MTLRLVPISKDSDAASLARQLAPAIDPEDGLVWRWERRCGQ
ncbi:MAG TPA: hypothetical protein VD846_10845 [Allosphingosinicella sp.]|nr:hypothetical protein [Allosphingosinicella sp.]